MLVQLFHDCDLVVSSIKSASVSSYVGGAIRASLLRLDSCPSPFVAWLVLLPAFGFDKQSASVLIDRRYCAAASDRLKEVRLSNSVLLLMASLS